MCSFCYFVILNYFIFVLLVIKLGLEICFVVLFFLIIYNGFIFCSDFFYDLEFDFLKIMCFWMYMYFVCLLVLVLFKYDCYNLLLICNFYMFCLLLYLCFNLLIKLVMIDSCYDSLLVLLWMGVFLIIILDNWGFFWWGWWFIV